MTHERIAASLAEIETQWTLEDCVDAHLTLDAIEHAEAEAAKPPPDLRKPWR